MNEIKKIHETLKKKSTSTQDKLTPLKIKMQLLQISINKKIVFGQHLKTLYEEYEKLLNGDLKKIKQNIYKDEI